MDYRVYRADIRFWMIVILLSCAVGGSAGYLFFDAWWGCLLIPICIPVVQKRLRQGCLQKQTRQLKTEFREVMTLVFVGKCVCTDIPDERGGVPVDGSGTTDFDEWYCLS